MQQQYAQAQYSPRQLLESARRAEADGNVDLAIHVSRYVLEHFAGSPESAEAYNSLMRLGQAAPEQPSAYGATPTAMANGYGGQGSVQPAPQARFTTPAAPAPAWPAAQAPYAPMGQSNGHASNALSVPQSTHLNGAAPISNGANGYANGAAQYAPASRAPASAPANGAYAAQMQTPVQAIAATFAPAAPYRGGEAQGQAQGQAMIHHAPEVAPQYRGGRIVARFTFVAGGAMMVAGVISPVPALLGLLGTTPSAMGMTLVAGALIATGLLALLGAQTALAVFDQADNMRELVELERTRWNG